MYERIHHFADIIMNLYDLFAAAGGGKAKKCLQSSA